MIGFVNIVNGFDQTAVDDLITLADSQYIVPGQDLTYTNTPVSVTLAAGETYTVDNMWFDNMPDVGLEIFGQEGAGQTVIVRNSKFTNMKLPLRLIYIDNVIVESNLIEDVWSAMHIFNNINVTVEYNKIRRHGVKPGRSSTSWAGNWCHVANGNLDSLSIRYNLADRSSDTRENIWENTFAEDYVNIYYSVMTGNNIGQISDNYMMGAEEHCESGTGGGITIDQDGSGFVIQNNKIYNCGSFSLGLASSKNIQILDNLSYQTQVHDPAIRTNANHNEGVNDGPNKTSQLACTQWHAAGTPEVPVENITITGNRSNAVWQDGTDQNQWLDVDLTELHSDNNSNSFIIHKWDGGFEGASGQLSVPTQQEVYEAIVGVDEAGMFETHGQGPEYFDESR